jgi:hypothetical protein
MVSSFSGHAPQAAPSIYSEHLLITPEQARNILATRNGKNRAVRPNTVAKIANDIKEGRWQCTHQGIAFDETNVLIDGQHRLHAIVQANRPCEMLVTYNVSRKTFSVLDCGVSRTASDNLAYANVPRAKLVAPAIKHILLYYRFPKRTWSNIPFPTHSEISNFYAQHSDVIDQISALVTETTRQFKKINPTGLAVACYFAVESGHSLTTISTFCHGLGNGAGLSSENPLLIYRQFVINLKRAAPIDRNLQQYSTACLIKVFNCWVSNKNMKQFKAPGVTPMPTIVQPSLPNIAPLSVSVKKQVLSQANYTCQQCGAKEINGAVLQVDHIVPRSKGGTNDLSNLQCLCSNCNNYKADKISS